MTAAPYTIGPNDSLQAAIDIIRKHEIRELPVVEDGMLIGIITDRDLRQMVPSYPLYRDEKEIRHYTENLKVFSAMTANPVTVPLDAPLVKAAKLLHTYRITSLPVIDRERLAGIISVTDLLKVFIELCEKRAEL
jgi:acetoin utilization protein AcuB